MSLKDTEYLENKTKAISEKNKVKRSSLKVNSKYITLLPKHTKYLTLQSPETLILRTDYMKCLRKALGEGYTVSLSPPPCRPQECDGRESHVLFQPDPYKGI